MSPSLGWISIHFIQSPWLCSFVLSALDFGEFKRFDGRIYRNLRELSCLFYMLANTTLNRHGFQDV